MCEGARMAGVAGRGAPSTIQGLARASRQSSGLEVAGRACPLPQCAPATLVPGGLSTCREAGPREGLSVGLRVLRWIGLRAGSLAALQLGKDDISNELVAGREPRPLGRPARGAGSLALSSRKGVILGL